ncbi:biotin/lipoyl-binding protein [bacterium]|nr:biotin/lipoyl-binding protein [bacterium]
MNFEVRHKKKPKETDTYTIDVNEKDGKFEVSIGEEKKFIDAVFIDPATVSMLIDGRSYIASVVPGKDRKVVYINGREYDFEEGVEEAIDFDEAGPGKFEKTIKAPMPGSVVKINAKEGDTVKQGELLIIVEAMKMENEMRAPVDVIVEKVLVKEKEQVDGMQILMEVSREEGD